MRSIRIVFCLVMAVLFIAISVAAEDAKSNQINCFHNNRPENYHHYYPHKNKNKHHHHCWRDKRKTVYLYDNFNNGTLDDTKWSYANCGISEENGKLRSDLSKISSCTNTFAEFKAVPERLVQADLNIVDTSCGATSLSDCGVGAAISTVWFIDQSTGNWFWINLGLAIFDQPTPYIMAGSYQWNPNDGTMSDNNMINLDNINGVPISLNTTYTLKIVRYEYIVKFYVNNFEVYTISVPSFFDLKHEHDSALASLNSWLVGNTVEKSLVSTYDNVYAK